MLVATVTGEYRAFADQAALTQLGAMLDRPVADEEAQNLVERLGHSRHSPASKTASAV